MDRSGRTSNAVRRGSRYSYRKLTRLLSRKPCLLTRIVSGIFPPMSTNKRRLSKRVEALRSKTDDQFSEWAIDGALNALASAKNPLRLNFFSTAMRILFEHIMDTRSPEDEVGNANWFTCERKDGKPTRWQRVKFAIQGGLSETLVKRKLRIALPPLRKRLLDAVDELSKHVHGRENTIIRDVKEQDAVAEETIEAMNAFLDALHECREAVLKPIAEARDRRRQH